MKRYYKRVVCNDGFSVSIQANSQNYSVLDARSRGYSSVEIGYPSEPDIFILPYAEDPNNLTGTIYGYVPASVVRKMIAAHGGLVEGEIPPLA